jgi:hypothetical protein
MRLETDMPIMDHPKNLLLSAASSERKAKIRGRIWLYWRCAAQVLLHSD